MENPILSGVLKKLQSLSTVSDVVSRRATENSKAMLEALAKEYGISLESDQE